MADVEEVASVLATAIDGEDIGSHVRLVALYRLVRGFKSLTPEGKDLIYFQPMLLFQLTPQELQFAKVVSRLASAYVLAKKAPTENGGERKILPFPLGGHGSTF